MGNLGNIKPRCFTAVTPIKTFSTCHKGRVIFRIAEVGAETESFERVPFACIYLLSRRFYPVISKCSSAADSVCVVMTFGVPFLDCWRKTQKHNQSVSAGGAARVLRPSRDSHADHARLCKTRELN